MRIEPVRRRHAARVGLTPLIDVVFLLLVFFIIGGRLEDESRIRLANTAAAPEQPAVDQPAVDQPAADQPAGAASERPAPLVLLALESETVWRFAGRAAAPEVVLEQLAGARAQQPTLEVVLVPGAALEAQGLVAAIDRLAALGVARIAYLAE